MENQTLTMSYYTE